MVFKVVLGPSVVEFFSDVINFLCSSARILSFKLFRSFSDDPPLNFAILDGNRVVSISAVVKPLVIRRISVNGGIPGLLLLDIFIGPVRIRHLN